MMEAMKAANLGLRFALELAMLAALGYWGFKTDAAPALCWTLGIGAPAAAAVVWGAFLSPKASVVLNAGLKLAIELAVFGVAAAALHASGRPASAAALLGVWAVNRILIAVWDQ
ncbi:YrdB family protein [Cohnella ginsengisoli]|uniref:YrdB family protein n=1 Tax=Cohnella ginsengisoli TaxID=425004 RepID=A0A9X4KSU4_9BACL|nr:YrdB family protein [Cohnella ginsengisoli]MDG0794925.1 YrdB family protein [Cohnella ginsengisoli]